MVIWTCYFLFYCLPIIFIGNTCSENALGEIINFLLVDRQTIKFKQNKQTQASISRPGSVFHSSVLADISWLLPGHPYNKDVANGRRKKTTGINLIFSFVLCSVFYKITGNYLYMKWSEYKAAVT